MLFPFFFLNENDVTYFDMNRAKMFVVTAANLSGFCERHMISLSFFFLLYVT